jgi:hypothetical protein
MARMLPRLPLILSWQSPPGDADAIHGHYVRHCVRNMDTWLAQSCPAELATTFQQRPLRGLYDDLPARSRERFVTAPETCRRLTFSAGPPRRGTVGFVSNSLWAEHCRVSPQHHEVAEPLWTALGDVCFSPRLARRSVGRRPRGRMRQLCAPRVADTIVLDAISPYSYVTTSDVSDETTHSPEEVRHLGARLNEAVMGMGAVSPSARHVLSVATKVIAMRKDARHPTRFDSASWGVHVGKIELTNAHLELVTISMLADGLVHEAIHALLDMLEVMDPFYVDAQAALKFSMISPWSGRSLQAPVYLHACFVWFGLWCFWCLAREADVFLGRDVERLLARTAAGFRSGLVLSRLSPIRRYLAPEVVHAIESVEATVLAH